MCFNHRHRLALGLLPLCLAWSTAASLDAFGATNLPAPASVALATNAPRPLSLADAQGIAFVRNWDLLAAAAGVDAATAQKIVSHEFPNPTFSYSTALINVDNHPSSTAAGNGIWDRSYDTIFAINQLFEIGGKRGSRQRSAQAGYEMAKAQLFDARRTLDLGVARAYAAAALAQANVQILKQSAESLRQEANLAAVRLNAGEISTADKNQIEITADRFEQDAHAAEATAAQARVALEVLLGVSRAKGEVVLSDSLESLAALALPANTNATGLLRPDVLAAEAAARKAGADLRLQKAYRIPDPTVLAQYEHEPPDNPNSIGMGVSFPLPLWNRNRGNILAAKAAQEQAGLAYEKAAAQAAADIATARFAYDDAIKRWQNYRDRIRPKSADVRKTKAYAYQKGGASLLDMLVAERDDNDVRLAAMQAANDTAVALAQLKAALMEMQPAEMRR